MITELQSNIYLNDWKQYHFTTIIDINCPFKQVTSILICKAVDTQLMFIIDLYTRVSHFMAHPRDQVLHIFIVTS